MDLNLLCSSYQALIRRKFGGLLDCCCRRYIMADQNESTDPRTRRRQSTSRLISPSKFLKSTWFCLLTQENYIYTRPNSAAVNS